MRLALAFALGCTLPAQVTVQVSEFKPYHWVGLDVYEEDLRKTRDIAWRAVRNEPERTLLNADSEFFERFFSPKLGEPFGISTFTDEGKDILVAKWKRTDPERTFEELILWDSPDRTTFLFRLDAGAQPSEARVADFFRNTLSKPPTPRADGYDARSQHDGVNLEFGRDPATLLLRGSGGLIGRWIPVNGCESPDQWIMLWETGKSLYIDVSFRKCISCRVESTCFVAERFPPLSVLCRGWSKPRILSELDHHTSKEGLEALRSSIRDQILIRELLTRDVTPQEFRWVLDRPYPISDQAALQAWADVNPGPALEATLRAFIEDLATGPQHRMKYIYYDSHAGSAFQSLWRAKVDLAELALDHAKRGLAGQGTFYYLGERAHTAEAYQVLRNATLDPLAKGGVDARAYAMKKIRERLGLDEEGRPKGSEPQTRVPK